MVAMDAEPPLLTGDFAGVEAVPLDSPLCQPMVAVALVVSRCTLPPTGAEFGSLGNETGLLGDIVHPDYNRDTAGGAWLDNGTHAAVMCYRTLWYHCGILRPGRSQLELYCNPIDWASLGVLHRDNQFANAVHTWRGIGCVQPYRARRGTEHHYVPVLRQRRRPDLLRDTRHTPPEKHKTLKYQDNVSPHKPSCWQ
jgi:hypothetical protein